MNIDQEASRANFEISGCTTWHFGVFGLVYLQEQLLPVKFKGEEIVAPLETRMEDIEVHCPQLFQIYFYYRRGQED